MHLLVVTSDPAESSLLCTVFRAHHISCLEATASSSVLHLSGTQDADAVLVGIHAEDESFRGRIQ